LHKSGGKTRLFFGFDEGGYMNKLELISALKNDADISKAEAAEVVQIFFDSMTDALVQGDRVEIRGLCSFFVKEYKSYTGRNPKTGEKVTIRPKKLPFFKCGKELKERVDYK
jgi:integration host factor subunit beta